MQVLEKNAGTIPFFELKAILKAKQKKWKKQAQAVGGGAESRKQLQDRNWASKSVLRYLETTAAEEQTRGSAQAFLKALEAKRSEAQAAGIPDGCMDSWELMPVEKLMLLDSRPSSPAELLLMIESCDQRFSEDEFAALLAIVDEHLPAAFAQEEEEEEGGGAMEDDEGTAGREREF